MGESVKKTFSSVFSLKIGENLRDFSPKLEKAALKFSIAGGGGGT
jgi:hypothetical protein